MVTLADALSYSALGWCIIPLKTGDTNNVDDQKKRPAVRWKRYQNYRPDGKRLAKWFDGKRDYGMAAIFGEISGGLASRDFDDLASYQRWAVEHPDLAKILPTVETSRGRHVYCRFARDDVAAFRRSIGKPDGIGAIHCDGGELRIGVGCYSVIPPSRHPSGFIYRWLVSPFGGPIPLLTVSESGFYLHATESTESTEAMCASMGGEAPPTSGTKIRKKTTKVGKTKRKPKPKTKADQLPDKRPTPGRDVDATQTSCEDVTADTLIDSAIRSTLPKRPGQRNKLVFELARSLIAVPGWSDASFDQLQPLVRQWHNLARPYIRTPAFEETWADFIRAWPRVKYPKGKEPMVEIVANAFSADPPECVRHYESESLKQLASLCRELQRASVEGHFPLATRIVAKYFSVNPSTGSRWLKLLVMDGVIELVAKGTQKNARASRFRYRGALHQLKGEAGNV